MVATEHNLAKADGPSVAAAEQRLALCRADRKGLYIALASLLAVRALAMIVLPFVDTTEARYAETARPHA